MRSYRTLLSTYLAPLKRQVVLLAVLLFGGVGLQLVNPQIVRGYIDAAREGAALSALAAAALAFLGVALLSQAVALAETYMASDVGWRATNALRADLAAHCLALDLSFHNARTPGELIERVDGDVSTLANFFSRFVVVVVGSLVLLLGILALVFREDPRAGLLFLAVSAASLSFSVWARRIGARYALAQRQASAELFAFLEERLNALPDIQANGAQGYVLYRAQLQLRALFHRAQRAVLVGTLLGARWLITTAGWVATFALVAALFMGGEVTLGTAYLLVQYQHMVNRPLGQIVRQLRDLQQASASLQRVRDLLTTTTRVADGGRAALPAGPLDVEFDRVSFHYGRASALAARGASVDEGHAPAALRDVSFAVPAGRVLGLLGRTGSGKTTIARLLFRLYDATAGTIRVGGGDVRELALDSLRARVGLVTQEVQLFSATVRDNLTLFDPAVPDHRIAAALEELDMGTWLRSLPAGLDTLLGAGGTGLSAGQSQLLAFARVFLRDPGLVVLDEASSRLDPATERLVDRAVERLLAERTAIVIAHRLETVQRVHDVLILEDGAVAEYGTRAALAADPASRFAALLRAGTLEPPLPQTRGGAARGQGVLV
jgi:ABC-type multidrug transport system fused ATPase/permease subunit